MCNEVYLSKYCIGHGATADWKLVSKHDCECGMTPEKIYRQPHPYFNFRCQDCTDSNRFYEDSPAGKKWNKEIQDLKEEAEEREREENRPRNKLTKPKKSHMLTQPSLKVVSSAQSRE
ncbi:hypothetical protein F5Y16DRAFT_422213 [Xylariaceae sp. FL0255]|nr:hypothetical protein F5Y16DRAFT_422213 [Xylariaceae sp. FL0255]